MTNKAIIWFRNDLRLSDNATLNYAAQNNCQVIFLYIMNPDDNIGAAAKWFLHHALKSLEQDLKSQYNASLIIKSGNTDIILPEMIKKYDIDTVLWNRIYEPQKIARDITLKKQLKSQNINVETFNSSLLFEPFNIKNLSGNYFKVFTPFWKKCLSEIDHITDPHKIPDQLNIINITATESLTLDKLSLLPTKPNWAENWTKLYEVSEAKAHDLALEFMKSKMTEYKDARNFPAQKNTSFLSPYLHLGLISPKQLYFKAMAFESSKGQEHFLSEIGWREFSYHLLYNFPELPNKNFKNNFDNFPYKNNQEELKKWQKGLTGFPIIDAGMRQLWHTGWMHNRIRMVVASFLTKNLLIDWRIGQAWFWDCLIDADLASNSASWQWVSGSGADAAPYFRIFNPLMQSQKFDPQGEYIRKWVPEIAHLSDKEIHFPSNRDRYPAAMIDLNFSRNRALELYKNLS